MAGRRYFAGDLGGITEVSASYQQNQKEVRINWSYDPSDHPLIQGQDYRFILFRAKEGEPLQRLIQLVRKNPEYIDSKVDEKSTYSYAVQVVYESGKKSALSQETTVSTQ